MSRLSHLRGLLSRRSSSTSAVSKETKGMMERFRKLSKPVGRLTAGYLIAYLICDDLASAKREELVKAELEKGEEEEEEEAGATSSEELK